jgi:superfamily II DNA helicase RecQ
MPPVNHLRSPVYRPTMPQSLSKHRILREIFGYDAFRPGQEAIVDSLIAGRDVLAVMPTGSGKSLCFQVPALAHGGLAIVVSPLVALMQDQVQALKLAGVAAETINSSQSREDNVDIWKRGGWRFAPSLSCARAPDDRTHDRRATETSGVFDCSR